MAIPVAHQHVHQSRGQKRARVDAILRAAVEALEHMRRVEDLAGAGKRIGCVCLVVRVLLDHAELPGEFAAVFPERRVIRQDHEGLLDVKHPGGFEQCGGHE